MKQTTLLLAAALTMAMAAQAQVNIGIDVQNRGPKISPTHYGIFYEDINHAADGGLYAELIRNRSFEDGPRYGAPADMQAWSTFALAPSQLTATLIRPSKKKPLLNAAQHYALELNVVASADNPVCLVNTGYWGINAVQGRTYRLSFWMRGKHNGTIKARLVAPSTAPEEASVVDRTVYAESVVSSSGDKRGAWTKYTATLKADSNDPKAQLALVFDGKGTIDIDMVSLFPPTFKNRENGMRPDLANMLWQMHPKFMRFPGGCFVEGQESPDNAFRWERTIGPIEEREGHWNVNWGYRTTDGLGFHEYLQLAEDLGAKPLYVVNVGLWHGGKTAVEDLQPWIDECLGALEYANGPVTSKYGALRAKNGHPEPFNIEYLEIGNENNQPDSRQQSDRYYERYDKFRQAIRERYPDIKLIGNVVAWGDDNPKWDSTLDVDLLDEHYYRNPTWFTDAFHKYDSYPRTSPDGHLPTPKIYVGEYAVTSGFGNLGNMNAALGEAVYMMGMENNSDMVPLNSYAPIFVNENDAKWRPDMIRFNSHQVMGTPSYYVQMLMAQNIGTQVVRVLQDNPYPAPKGGQVTPLMSHAGFATWQTKASFTNVEGNAAIGHVETTSGNWKHDDNIVSQVSMREQCVAIEKNIINSDHYTLKYKARKDSGHEGFIIVFNYVDSKNYCWLNFGGWGNTQHGIEQIKNGDKMQTATKRGKVETGRWYDITAEIDGDHVKAWLDDELVFDTMLKRETTPGIFSSATIDERTGELIVKVVNTGEEQTTASVNLQNFKARQARVIRLATRNGDDENTLQQPTNIHPTEQLLSPVNVHCVLLDVPAYSLNIIRIKQ